MANPKTEQLNPSLPDLRSLGEEAKVANGRMGKTPQLVLRNFSEVEKHSSET